MAVFLIDMVNILWIAYFIGICEKTDKKKILKILVVLLIYISNILDYFWFISNILLCEFLLLGLCIKGKLVQKLAWFMKLQLMLVLLDSLLGYLRLIIIPTKADISIVRSNFGSLEHIVTREIIIFLISMFVWKKRPQIIQIFEQMSLIFSIYIIISMGISIFLLCTVLMWLCGIYINKVIPLFSIGTLFFSILQLVLCVMIQQLVYSKRELRRANEMNQCYIEQQQKYYEEIDKKNMELRSFRHDFNEHVYVMNDMAGRESIEELKEYLSNLSQKKKTVYYINTGNHVANAVVNRYYEMAQEQGIAFVYMGKLSEELCEVTDVEFCSVLSNILKNAFEAVLRISEDKEKKIIVEMGRENMYEYIYVENTAVGYEESDGKLITHKKDKEHHGIGMENVKKIMEKCGGKLVWKYENEVFYTWVYFLTEKMTS